MTRPAPPSPERATATTTAAVHVPVLLDEVLAALAPRPDGVYLDATFGAGGYSRALLDAAPGCRVVGLDRDPEAVARGRAMAAERPGLTVVEGRFGDLGALLKEAGVRPPLDGAVFDLGVSSAQLGDPARGFSFAADGPLDMRMGPGEDGPTAADVVNNAAEAELARILAEYGEEPAARRIARAIVRRRAKAPFRGTRELAALVAGALGGRRGARTDPATRTFQALRIHVNDELGELERGLAAAEGLLRAPGGRLAVVAFHSLEDRIVKRFLAERAGALPRPSRHLPPSAGEDSADRARPAFRLLTRGAVRPGEAELAHNPRARSARLRAAERLGGDGAVAEGRRGHGPATAAAGGHGPVVARRCAA